MTDREERPIASSSTSNQLTLNSPASNQCSEVDFLSSLSEVTNFPSIRVLKLLNLSGYFYFRLYLSHPLTLVFPTIYKFFFLVLNFKVNYQHFDCNQCFYASLTLTNVHSINLFSFVSSGCFSFNVGMLYIF